jgi:hypothetical protein
MDRAWLHEGKPVFLHDVQRSALKPLRQKIFDEGVCGKAEKTIGTALRKLAREAA